MRTTDAPVPDLYPMHAGRDSGHPGMSAELFTARYFQHAAHVPAPAATIGPSTGG
jgi:hypothetical protein